MEVQLRSVIREGTRGIAVQVLVLVVLASTLAGAQQIGDDGVADSASVARTAWAAAVRLMRAEDLAGARREVDRAAAAWPAQPSYVWTRALLAARSGDTAAARAGLDAYANLGLGRDLRGDSSVRRLLAADGFAEIAARHERNRAPLARSSVRARLSDSTFFPEGIDYDPRTGRVYVSSVRHGTIAEIDRSGATREILSRTEPGIGAILAVRIDTVNDVLWATSSGIAQRKGLSAGDTTLGQLLRIDLRSRRVTKRYDFSRATRHTLGDIAVGSRGDVFVTDSEDAAFYWLRPDSDSLIRITSPLFRSLQGIAPVPRSTIVYLADYSHGLLRLDLTTRVVSWLGIPAGGTPIGIDGLAWHEGSLIAVQNGVSPPRIVRFDLNAAGTRITRSTVIDQNFEIADEPTAGTVADGHFLYVANSQWEQYDRVGVLKPNARLAAPVILAIPLSR
jgi:hypothetical protein